jgi:hypothetical protein
VGYSYLDNSSVLRQILGPNSPVRDEGKPPEDLAFQATVHQRLGQAAEARSMLDRLRELMRQVVLAGGQGDQGRAFLAEADAVVVHDPIFPADSFSRRPACTGPRRQPNGPSFEPPKGPFNCRTLTSYAVLSTAPLADPVSAHRPDFACIGPTTPMRARRLADASVDPTDARNVAGSGPDD